MKMGTMDFEPLLESLKLFLINFELYSPQVIPVCSFGFQIKKEK